MKVVIAVVLAAVMAVVIVTVTHGLTNFPRWFGMLIWLSFWPTVIGGAALLLRWFIVSTVRMCKR